MTTEQMQALDRAVASTGIPQTHVPLAYLNLLQVAGRREEAVEALLTALCAFAEDPEALERFLGVAAKLSQYAAAVQVGSDPASKKSVAFS